MDAQPPKFLIREATPDDAAAIAEVHVRTWQIAYVDFFSAEYLDSQSSFLTDEAIARRAERLGDPAQTTLIAIEGNRVLGFAAVMLNRHDLGSEVGELGAIYVDPDCWDRGVGGTLLDSAETRLAVMGFRGAILWTLAENTRTRRFYENHGWAVDGATQAHSTGVPLVRYAKQLQR